jgi:uncharacterized surface anchored protein
VTADGTAENVSTYNAPTIKEQVNTFRLWKYQQEGTEKYAIPGTVFTHTKPNGSTETLTTGSDGYITLKGLETGTHKFVETKAVDGYQLKCDPDHGACRRNDPAGYQIFSRQRPEL